MALLYFLLQETIISFIALLQLNATFFIYLYGMGRRILFRKANPASVEEGKVSLMFEGTFDEKCEEFGSCPRKVCLGGAAMLPGCVARIESPRHALRVQRIRHSYGENNACHSVDRSADAVRVFLGPRGLGKI